MTITESSRKPAGRSTCRWWRAVVLAALAAVALAACNSGQQSTSDTQADTGTADGQATTASPTTTSSPSPDADDEAAFPVTIDHKFGSTEISQEPERVVTVGLTDHDAFLALGVTPVGVTDWFGERPHATWPWAQRELGDAEPEIVGMRQELDFEKIAAQQPEVIVGLYSAMDEQTYERLSEIAPTVAQPGDHANYAIPWQELTRTAGRVVGRQEQAEELVGDIEEQFAQAREDHPEFVGASAAIASPFEGIYVYSENVANGRLLGSLGFEQPDELSQMIGDKDGTSLSLERVQLLDTDVLVWIDAAEGEGPLDQDLYQQLDVAQEGREMLIDSSSELGGAMSFSSVLSLPFVLDELVPRLEAAIDGDPATEPAPATP